VLFTYCTMRAGLDTIKADVAAPSGITLRQANSPRDLAAVAQLYGEAFGDAPWPSDWTSFPGYDPAGVFVAEEGHKLVGFVVSFRRGEHGYISVAATSPDRRRHGIARALVTSALLRFRAQGLSEVIIDVRGDNAAAIRCYESLGFRRVGEFTADEHCRAPQDEDAS
jgi:ribosomal-protein-alanine N-acetyltransferase